MTLVEDLEEISDSIPFEASDRKFDAVLCMGNSFSHLPVDDVNYSVQRRALGNLMDCVKPGGILVIDHRNFDELVRTGIPPPDNTYYKVGLQSVRLLLLN